jgi:hypothetical protein
VEREEVGGVKPGDIVCYRTGRSVNTRDIIWDTGLILEIHPDDFDGGEKCKILNSGGRVKWIRSHGTKVLIHNETW